MAKRAPHFNGYVAYRYGTGRPITLAGQPRVDVVPPARRDTITSATITILEGWRSSKFEFEGACRHGVRAGLCLDGFSYHSADAWSEKIVAEALRRIGANRPTWGEGQPEWTQYAYAPIEHVDCERCGKPLTDAKPGQRFCSDVCRDAAKSLRHARLRRVTDAAERAAIAAASLRARRDATRLHKTKVCESCGNVFEGANRHARFCSLKCFGDSLRTPHTCIHCGATFMAKACRDRKYCSSACSVEARNQPPPPPPAPLAERVCGW
jgi:hypothetical protein